MAFGRPQTLFIATCFNAKVDVVRLDVRSHILDSMGLHALHQEILPPSGVEFVVSLKLTPSTAHHSGIDDGTKVLCNVVVARTNLLRIFEAREQPPPTLGDEERDKKAKVRKGTEAVEGEVEMDEHGEGFINIAQVITTTFCSKSIPNAITLNGQLRCQTKPVTNIIFSPPGRKLLAHPPSRGCTLSVSTSCMEL